jgi:hypothetical protein
VVLDAVADEPTRRQLLDRFADWPWLERIRSEGPDAVFAAMAEIVKSQIPSTKPQTEQKDSGP